MSTSQNNFDFEEEVKKLTSSVNKLRDLEQKREDITNEINELREEIQPIHNKIYKYLDSIRYFSTVDKVVKLPAIDREYEIKRRPYRGVRVDKDEVVTAYHEGIPRDLFLGSTNMKSVDRWIKKLEKGVKP